MRSTFFLLFVSFNLFAAEDWTTIKKEEIDLNNDGKKDEILWLKKSKSKQTKPERLVINIDKKAVLDYSRKFCLPGDGYGNPDFCYDLMIESKMSSKKQPLVIL